MLKNKDTGEKTAFCFLLPSFLGTAVFVSLPFADVVRRSFFRAVGNAFVGWQNYRDVIADDAFQKAFWQTLKFMGISIPLLLVLSFCLAFLISRLHFGREWLETFFLLPMALPPAMIAVLFRLIVRDSKILDTDAAFFVPVACFLVKNIGYDMVLWLAGLSDVSKKQEEAAKMDGANLFQRLIYITLPQMKQSFVLIGVLSLVNAFKIFREIWLIAGEYPHQSIYMIQHLFQRWFLRLDIQKMSAAAVMLAAAIGFLLFAAERQGRKEEWE